MTKLKNRKNGGVFMDSLSAEEFYEWYHDDITWCGNDCHYTECERNKENMPYMPTEI